MTVSKTTKMISAPVITGGILTGLSFGMNALANLCTPAEGFPYSPWWIGLLVLFVALMLTNPHEYPGMTAIVWCLVASAGLTAWIGNPLVLIFYAALMMLTPLAGIFVTLSR
ncbi:MAG: hypothetical protein GY832_30930 [Chloroflexi bacterium]|nr:hypothetical protein [Chloroflexota bacterium]